MRTTLITLLMGFLVIFSRMVNAQELWVGVELEKQILPRIKTQAKLQLRNDIDNNSTFIDESIIQTYVDYKLFKNVTIGASFRYAIKIENFNDQAAFKSYDEKYRLAADLKYKSNWLNNDIRISNRLRYQYNPSHKNDKQFVRDKIKCNYKLTKRAIPYLALETFYSIYDETMQTIRLYIGNEFELIYNKLDVYFIFEINEQDHNYQSYQVIGVNYVL